MKNHISHQLQQKSSVDTSLNLWKHDGMPHQNIKSVHIIGAAGVGMRGLRICLDELKFQVSGTDDYNHEPWMIKSDQPFSADCLVVTSVTPVTHPQYIYAKKNNIPIFHRATFLKYIIGQNAICISGTHGKTTTTGILSWIMHNSTLKSSFIIGDILKNLQTYAQFHTNHDVCVVESDESDGSMQKLTGKINLITCIDYDHMDYYKTYDKLQSAFTNFANNCEKCIINYKTLNDVQINNQNNSLEQHDTKIITYSIDNQNADVFADNIVEQSDGISFNLRGAHHIDNLFLSMNGLYNLENAIGAIAAALENNVDENVIKQSLLSFQGMKKRLDKYEINGIKYILDYAHHPYAIKQVSKAIINQSEKSPQRDHANSNLNNTYLILEIHKNSRLRNQFDEFVESISQFKNIAILPVHRVNEDLDVELYNKFIDAIKLLGINCIPSENLHHAIEHMKPAAGDTVLCIGAGKICKSFYEFVKSSN